MELSSIYATAPIGLAVFDTQLRYVRINERLAAINGLSVEEHIGRSVAEVTPDIAPQAEQVLRRVLDTGQPLRDVEIRGRRTPSDPVERIWLEQFTPLRDESGAIVAISVVAEDITDRRRLEQEVRRGHEKLQAALDAARLVMWEWEVDTDEARFALGDWAGEASQGTPHSMAKYRELVHPDDLMHFDACIQGHLTGLEPMYECEYRIRTPDGSYRWALSKGRVCKRSATGEPLVMTGFRQDITAQRQAVERLAASERELQVYRDRLDIALEAGRMGVWEWLPGREEGYWSPQIFEFVEIAPAPDGKARGADFLELVHPEDRPAVDAQLAKALDEAGDYEVEFRLRVPSGTQRWMLSRGRVIHDHAGNGSRLVGINLDITRQKMLEDSLRESDARRNEFLAMLGHELRNPLAPIANAARLLERHTALDGRQEAAVQIIQRQSQHMARLVDDLLEVSRITQGRIELRMENVLVATAAYSAVETARPLARQKEQRIEVNVPPDLDVVADPARLTQVLSNLVVNAAKYTQAGGHIRVIARAPNERFVEIEVADNGMGISPELLPNIFELFTQDRRTLDRSEGGLGLGLALVERLVKLHGGHVTCKSPGPGQGSTFTVCLPRRGRREKPRTSSLHPVATKIPPTSMLVVDDNRDSAETMAALLAIDGHRVSLAFNGSEALEHVAGHAPRVVLLDIGLPGISGLEVARRMRELPSLANTIIIGMSGYAQAEDRAASEAAGFDAHLAKPADVADVYRVLEQLRS